MAALPTEARPPAALPVEARTVITNSSEACHEAAFLTGEEKEEAALVTKARSHAALQSEAHTGDDQPTEACSGAALCEEPPHAAELPDINCGTVVDQPAAIKKKSGKGVCHEQALIAVGEKEEEAIVSKASHAARNTEAHTDDGQLPDITGGKVVRQPAAPRKKVRQQNPNGPWKKTHRGCRGGKNRRKPLMNLSQPRLRAAHRKQARPSTTEARKEARPIAARKCQEKARPNAASRQIRREYSYPRQFAGTKGFE